MERTDLEKEVQQVGRSRDLNPFGVWVGRAMLRKYAIYYGIIQAFVEKSILPHSRCSDEWFKGVEGLEDILTPALF